MDLIVKNDELPQPSQPKIQPKIQSSKPKFPSAGDSIFNSDVPTQSVFPTAKRVSSTPTNVHLSEIVGVYERHFASLNKDGYDFYEFYEAMSGLSPKTPDTYRMALHFAKQMGGEVNKGELLSVADYYVTELNNLHDHQKQAGEVKLSELNVNKREEKAELEGDINNLNAQIEALLENVSTKKHELSSIDSRYATQIESVEDKLNTNTVARDTIVNSITEIRTGIESNI